MKVIMNKKLYLTFAVVALLAGMLCGCAGGQNAGTKDATPRKVIIDTDTAGDDASALILAAKSSSIDILGVTVLEGNVDLEQATKNALASLEIAGCDAPVYKGADTTYTGEQIEAFSVYGNDGMGDKDIVHPVGKTMDQDAVDFIIETVKKYPDEVEIIALGPATNIANAIDKDPAAMEHVKRIWSMGTAGLGPGNSSPVSEFNVMHDAPAYQRMLQAGMPITIVGLDVCGGDALWTDAQFDKLSKVNEIGAFVTAAFSKLREYDASNGSAGKTMNCDSTAMMCAVTGDYVKNESLCHASCITDPGEAYAMVIFYPEGRSYDVVKNDFEYNVTLVNEVDGATFFNRYYQAIK